MSRQTRLQLFRNIFSGNRKAARRNAAPQFNQPAELLEQRRLLSATTAGEMAQSPAESEAQPETLTHDDVFSLNSRSGVLKVRGSSTDDVARIESTSDGSLELVVVINGNTFRQSLTGVSQIVARLGDGNDFFDGSDASTELAMKMHGEDGNDTLVGGSAQDRVYGGSGNDDLRGGDSADLLDGGLGNDALQGDAGDDELRGREGNDVLNGGEGNDRVRESNVNAFKFSLSANARTMTLTRGGNDAGENGENDGLIGIEQLKVFGTSEADDLDSTGFEGFVRLFGQDGNDRLIGTAASDYLNGGDGSDLLLGMGGIDRFNAADPGFVAPSETADPAPVAGPVELVETQDVIITDTERPDVQDARIATDDSDRQTLDQSDLDQFTNEDGSNEIRDMIFRDGTVADILAALERVAGS